MTKDPVIRISPLGFPWQTQDPFLFCVYHQDFYPPGNPDMGPNESLQGRNLGHDFTIRNGWRMYHGHKIPGFPAHPHRGFETVTVVQQGLVDHADSLGAAGRYGAGDTQWLTAGRGVQHSEMFPLLSEDKENTLELFQIWLNLPSEKKMVKPHFTMFWKDTIPRYNTTDEDNREIDIEIIAGEIAGYNPPAPPPDSWAANPENKVAIWVINLQQGAKWTLPSVDGEINRSLYFYRGSSIKISDNFIPVSNQIELRTDIEVQLENGEEYSSLLMLQGVPINEPVAHYGPFVMNTKTELEQAFSDYRQTQFGGWPWPDMDQVFPKTKGRFARHADGNEENKV